MGIFLATIFIILWALKIIQTPYDWLFFAIFLFMGNGSFINIGKVKIG